MKTKLAIALGVFGLMIFLATGTAQANSDMNQNSDEQYIVSQAEDTTETETPVETSDEDTAEPVSSDDEVETDTDSEL